MLSQESAILVKNAAGLGFMLRAALKNSQGAIIFIMMSTMLSTLKNYLGMLSQKSAILVQNATGLGLMLRAAERRTQHKP